jgi:spermidine synthase
LRVYAAIEAGIALCGLLVLLVLPVVDKVYVAGSETGLPGALLRAMVAAVILLPPTILMGASLPAIVRWIKATPSGASWWGMLYGGNIAGAVFGCLLAGFYLLRIYNMPIATFVAVAINLGVAGLSLAMSSRTPSSVTPRESAAEEDRAASEDAGPRWPIYAATAISGACSLGGEVVWTRLMGYMLGATVYVFSVILAVFLMGLAIGSALGSWIARVSRPRVALGWCQAVLTLAIAWTAYMIANSLPYWPINPLLTVNTWHIFQLDMVRCLWAILPPTILWGASFPLAMAAVARPGEDSGRLVGSVYAANTLGSIVGALSISLVLIPSIGTQQCERLILAGAAVASLIILVPWVKESRSQLAAMALTGTMVIAGFLVKNVDPVPGALIAYGRRMAVSAPNSKVLYTIEGRNSSAAITQWSDGAYEIDVNGHVEATTEPYDMKLQRMVGHLPGLLHPNPKRVLGIGFGAGVSAGTFTRYPGIDSITICEIEPVIPPTSTKYFYKQDYDVMHNPKTRIVFDDARHYMLTTTDKFDIIASDPLDVFAKGTAAIYSKEYFESVKRHLNPGGMFTLYVPLYESDEVTVRSELATFFAVFPDATVWANTVDGRGYDMVFMGGAGPMTINLDEVQQRFERPDYAPVVESFREIGLLSPSDLLSTYAGRRSDLGAWVGDVEINTDRDLRLGYLAGWGINSVLEDVIYRHMMSYRKRPEGLFVGSKQRVDAFLNSLAF